MCGHVHGGRPIMTGAPADRRHLVHAAAVLLLALVIAGLAVQPTWQRGPFVAFALLQGVVYAAAAIAVWRGQASGVGIAFILIVAALLRAGPLFGPVIWTSDIYRYVWDGWVQQAGFNPYCCVPADPQLAHLRDAAIYPQINRRDFAPTIYPPVAQMTFLVNAWLGGTVLSMKLLLVAIETLGIGAMLAVLRRLGRPAQGILLYAWHPLPIWEIAGSGHIDALFVAAVPLAILAAISGRRVLTGIALGAAVLTKFIPLVLFPALWRRPDWRMPAALAAFIVAGYLPYSSVGLRVLGYLPGYAEEEKLTAGAGQGFWLVDTLRSVVGLDVSGGAYLAFAALLVAGLGFAALRRPPEPAATVRWAAVLGVTTLLLLSPHYAWYFVLPVALLTLSPWPPAFWPTLTAFLLYWEPDGGRIPTWAGAVIYGGFAVAAILWQLRRRVPRSPGAEHVSSRTA
jgi:hypothetical protein